MIENASRPGQRILSTTIDRLSEDLTEAAMSGPALTFLGLAPREAALAAQDAPLQEMA